MKPTPLLVAALCTVTIAPAVRAAQNPPQKGATPAPQQAQLEERIRQLETRLSEAEKKATAAELEKGYVERMEKDSKDFYQTAFLAELGIFSVLAIIIGLVGKFGVDHIVAAKLTETSAKLREEFKIELANSFKQSTDRLQILDDDLTGRITEKVDNLEARSRYAFQYLQGLSFGVSGQHDVARRNFRWALEDWLDNRDRFTPKTAPPALLDLFRAIKLRNPQKFVEEATRELANPIYTKLEDDLHILTQTFPELAPLIDSR